MNNDKTKKQSVTKTLEPVIDMLGKADVNDHMIIILEADENGTPTANLIKLQASPFMALGMIDMLKNQLKEKRDYVLEKFEHASIAGKLANEADALMPHFSERLRNALQSDNVEELMKLREEAKDMLKKLNPDNPDASKDDDDEFNLEAFKGLF